jgi:serine protease Do
VTRVESFSAAAEAGLRVGDLIIEASRRDVERPSDLRRILADLGSGDVLLLRVVTESTRRFVAIRMPDE